MLILKFTIIYEIIPVCYVRVYISNYLTPVPKDTNMKICLVNDFFPPKVTGGTELFLKALYDYLKKEGFVVFLITQTSVTGNTGFKTYRLNSSPINLKHMKQIPGITLPWLAFNRDLVRSLKKIYQKEKPDLLHINNLYHLSLAPLQASNKPFLLDVHDYWPVCFSKDLFKDDKRFCKQEENWRCSFCLSKKFNFPLEPFFIPNLYIESSIKRKILARAKEVVCHSEFVRDRLKERGYSAKVVPYPYFGKEASTNPKGKTKQLRLLFIGRVEYKKGADILLKIAEALKQNKLNFRIDLIGDGILKNTLNRKDLNIFTHGFLGDEKYEYLQKADFLVAPSRWPEPFGMVALEAMKFSLPVITLDTSGGLKDIVKQNRIGVVSTEKTIARDIINLYNSKNQIELFRNNCKNIKKYDKEKVFKEYIKLFEKIYDRAQ